jgi:general secretion pathway protein G
LTLLEVMLAVALAAVLGTIAVVAYGGAMERTRFSRAVADITELQLLISRFNTNQGRFPASLAEVGAAGRADPWGNPYRYLNFEDVSGHAGMRKDRNLVPINSDFDLYSAGPDGATRPPLTASPSRDDIVRANDGRFVGKASDY